MFIRNRVETWIFLPTTFHHPLATRRERAGMGLLIKDRRLTFN
jgi:hypothetical protein